MFGCVVGISVWVCRWAFGSGVLVIGRAYGRGGWVIRRGLESGAWVARWASGHRGRLIGGGLAIMVSSA